MNVTDYETLPSQLLDHADAVRRQLSPQLALKRKSALGQFMTPSPVARFMASLFPPTTLQTCRLLDAGAGIGALSCAFLDRWVSTEDLRFQAAEVEAYEIDETLRKHLEATLGATPGGYLSRIRFTQATSFGRRRAQICWG